MESAHVRSYVLVVTDMNTIVSCVYATSCGSDFVPQKIWGSPIPPIPVNVTLFGHGVFADVSKLR